MWYFNKKTNMETKINTKLTEEIVLSLGFYKLPHFTIGNYLIFDLPNNRQLSLSSVGTPNEMLCITQSDYDDIKNITDVITLHNYDYHKYLNIHKLKTIIDALNF
jgi:hypothetical protein